MKLFNVFGLLCRMNSDGADTLLMVCQTCDGLSSSQIPPADGCVMRTSNNLGIRLLTTDRSDCIRVASQCVDVDLHGARR